MKKLKRRGYTVKDETGERFVYDLTEDDRRFFETMCQEFEGTPEQFFLWAETFISNILERDPGRRKKAAYDGLRQRWEQYRQEHPEDDNFSRWCKRHEGAVTEQDVKERLSALRRQQGLDKKTVRIS